MNEPPRPGDPDSSGPVAEPGDSAAATPGDGQIIATSGGPRQPALPRTPVLAGLVAVLAAVGAVLVLMCTAGAFVPLQAHLVGQVRSGERAVERLQSRRAEEIALDGTFDQLEGFLLGLYADAYSFPETLPELAPDDPWGRPIRYERLDVDRARLESDGPDRRPDTSDDIPRVVLAR